MAKQSFLDILAEVLGDIVTDVREHVVEEPWYGRTLGPDRDAAPEQRPEIIGPDLDP